MSDSKFIKIDTSLLNLNRIKFIQNNKSTKEINIDNLQIYIQNDYLRDLYFKKLVSLVNYVSFPTPDEFNDQLETIIKDALDDYLNGDAIDCIIDFLFCDDGSHT